ncbi:DUF6255 family natural product biosynthesis protein [Streptomyces triculaminicus]|uniref:DUF6255 family natural product biosynthesis protein n=1 Tax=Streptomyces triculaminicus TaxID=2816232 RepID=UPI0037CF9999
MTCHHPEWESAGTGEARCKQCGTRRFTDYGALRPPGLPQAVRPPARRRAKADRTAATLISRTAYHLSHWSLSSSRSLLRLAG